MYTYIPSRLIRLIYALTTLRRRISFSFFFPPHVDPHFFSFTLEATVKISLAKIYPSCAFLRARNDGERTKELKGGNSRNGKTN